MKTPCLKVPKARKGLKFHKRSSGFVITRPTIAPDGRLVRRPTLALLSYWGLLYKPVPAALPPRR